MGKKIGDLEIARASIITALAPGVGEDTIIKLGLRPNQIAYIRGIRFSVTSTSLLHAVSANPEKVANLANFGLIADDPDLIVHSDTEEIWDIPDPGYKVARNLRFFAMSTAGGAGNHWVTVFYQKQMVSDKEIEDLVISRR